jgi:hypothetical protein
MSLHHIPTKITVRGEGKSMKKLQETLMRELEEKVLLSELERPIREAIL